jgi:hypothetical protein
MIHGFRSAASATDGFWNVALHDVEIQSAFLHGLANMPVRR